jgi:CRP-like cAMP-binding protein
MWGTVSRAKITIPPNNQIDTDSFNAFLTLSRQQHHKGSTIIHAGDSSDCLYYVQESSLSVLIEDTDGHEIIVAYLNVGDVLGKWLCLVKLKEVHG